MNTNKKPQRTIKAAIDLDDGKMITSNFLLNASIEESQDIRIDATKRYRNNNSRYICYLCGSPVFISHSTGKPLWNHYKGSQVNCPWYTPTQSPNRISAKQYDGAQESERHYNTKHQLANILEKDPSAECVLVEKTVFSEGSRRRPDVQATYEGRKVAFEIQLSYTLLPTISDREEFYEKEGYILIWVMYKFNSEFIKQAERDAHDYSGNKIVFSIDEETIKRSMKKDKLILRCFTCENDKWKSEFRDFTNLSKSPLVPLKERWLEIVASGKQDEERFSEYIKELCEKSKIDIRGDFNYFYEINKYKLWRLIDCFLSLEKDKIIGTKEKNLIAYSNSFLSTNEMKKYGNIFEKIAKKFGHDDLLEKPSVKNKLVQAKQTKQIGINSPEVKILKRFSRNWFD